MKKIIFTIFTLALLVIAFNAIQPVKADLLTNEAKTRFTDETRAVAIDAEYEVGADVQLETVIGQAIRLALSVLGIIFITLMFLTGNDWMQAAGNEEKVRLAKSRIQSLLIGLVVVLVAFALSYGFSGLLGSLIK